MILKRIDPISCAKINGLVSVAFGLIFGLMWSTGAVMIGTLAGRMGGDGPGGLFALIFGVGSVVFLPLFYGIFGFIFGLVAAWLYNVFAGWIGGIDVEFEQTTPPPSQTMQA